MLISLREKLESKYLSTYVSALEIYKIIPPWEILLKHLIERQ